MTEAECSVEFKSGHPAVRGARWSPNIATLARYGHHGTIAFTGGINIPSESESAAAQKIDPIESWRGTDVESKARGADFRACSWNVAEAEWGTASSRKNYFPQLEKKRRRDS